MLYIRPPRPRKDPSLVPKLGLLHVVPYCIYTSFKTASDLSISRSCHNLSICSPKQARCGRGRVRATSDCWLQANSSPIQSTVSCWHLQCMCNSATTWLFVDTVPTRIWELQWKFRCESLQGGQGGSGQPPGGTWRIRCFIKGGPIEGQEFQNMLSYTLLYDARLD